VTLPPAVMTSNLHHVINRCRTDSAANLLPMETLPGTIEHSVNNIIYEMPEAKGDSGRLILTVFVDNQPGVLSRISGLLAARGFNIDSLSVGATDVKGLSRMTICMKATPAQVVQAEKQLEDLFSVWAVIDNTSKSMLERELALVKVSTVPESVSKGLKKVSKVVKLDPQQTQKTHYHRQAVLDIAKMFDAKVSDIGAEYVVMELSAWQRRVGKGFIVYFFT
jgi:acetolactate synthase-1/3 small subunit